MSVPQVRNLFDCAASLRADADLANLLRLWSLKAKLANMHVVRLLALIKASVSSNRPTCLKLLAGGLLSLVSRDHVAAGGGDPRFVLRDELIKDGMLLESVQRRPTVSPQMARGPSRTRTTKRPRGRSKTRSRGHKLLSSDSFAGAGQRSTAR